MEEEKPIPFGMMMKFNKTEKMKTELSSKQTTHESFMVEAGNVKQIVETQTGISDFDYKLAIYEMGLKFLEQIFPSDSPTYKKYFAYIESQKTYWKWFRSEWHLFEQDLIKFMLENKIPINYTVWQKEMDFICQNKKIENSFQNYIRIFLNDRI